MINRFALGVIRLFEKTTSPKDFIIFSKGRCNQYLLNNNNVFSPRWTSKRELAKGFTDKTEAEMVAMLYFSKVEIRG